MKNIVKLIIILMISMQNFGYAVPANSWTDQLGEAIIKVYGSQTVGIMVSAGIFHAAVNCWPQDINELRAFVEKANLDSANKNKEMQFLPLAHSRFDGTVFVSQPDGSLKVTIPKYKELTEISFTIPKPKEKETISSQIVDSNMTFEEAMRKECPPEFKDKQELVEVQYYSFDGKIHKGQIVIDKRLAGDIREVFQIALKEKFPIASAIPISNDRFYKDGKWNEDDLSMLSNNTSAFNYRTVTGGKALSNHAYGFAIDINPLQNPYIKEDIVLPPGAVYDISKLGTLTADSSIVKAFLRLGWEWGGSWKTLKDYQHFEKVLQ